MKKPYNNTNSNQVQKISKVEQLKKDLESKKRKQPKKKR